MSDYDGSCAICGRELDSRKSAYFPRPDGGKDFFCRLCCPPELLPEKLCDKDFLRSITPKRSGDFLPDLIDLKDAIVLADETDENDLRALKNSLYEAWLLVTERCRQLDKQRKKPLLNLNKSR